MIEGSETMKWIKTTEKLPELGQFVLARHNLETWLDDDPNVVCVVVKRVPYYFPFPSNNLKPYTWEPFGPGSFNGQDIDWWLEIPEWDDVRRQYGYCVCITCKCPTSSFSTIKDVCPDCRLKEKEDENSG